VKVEEPLILSDTSVAADESEESNQVHNFEEETVGKISSITASNW
jgi:hypothetical protein